VWLCFGCWLANRLNSLTGQEFSFFEKTFNVGQERVVFSSFVYSHGPHVDYASDAVSCLHVLKSCVDLGECLPVCDELVHLEFAGHVVVYEVRQLRPALDAAKGTSFPHSSRDQLKG
jgi:hypothetical protein